MGAPDRLVGYHDHIANRLRRGQVMMINDAIYAAIYCVAIPALVYAAIVSYNRVRVLDAWLYGIHAICLTVALMTLVAVNDDRLLLLDWINMIIVVIRLVTAAALEWMTSTIIIGDDYD